MNISEIYTSKNSQTNTLKKSNQTQFSTQKSKRHILRQDDTPVILSRMANQCKQTSQNNQQQIESTTLDNKPQLPTFAQIVGLGTNKILADIPRNTTPAFSIDRADSPAREINLILRKHDQFSTFSMKAKNAQNALAEKQRNNLKDQDRQQKFAPDSQYSLSPISPNNNIVPTLIKTEEISKMKESEILEDFWSHSESGLDLDESEDDPSGLESSKNRGQKAARGEFGKVQNSQTAGLVSFKYIKTVHTPQTPYSEAISIDSNRSQSNIQNGMASERSDGIAVPIFHTKMISDLSKKCDKQNV